MNRVLLSGRLTADPELSYGKSSNKAYCKFTLAVDRGGKDKDADFINCMAFGNTAEFAANWFHKGKPAEVDGQLRVRSYDGRDGKKWVTEVWVDRMYFALKDSTEKTQPAPRESEPRDESYGIFQAADDDIPF